MKCEDAGLESVGSQAFREHSLFIYIQWHLPELGAGTTTKEAGPQGPKWYLSPA